MLFSALFRKNIRNRSDLEIVGLIEKERDAAVAELYRRYAHLVMGLCLKYLKNQEEAADLVSKIFEQLERKVKVNEVKHFKSWLFTVSRNECLMVLRKKKVPNGEIDHALLSTPDTSETEHLEMLEKEKQLDQLTATLSHLKADQKKAIELFYLKQKCYAEVSEIMKIDLKKVKSLIQNGKRNLKIKMEEGI